MKSVKTLLSVCAFGIAGSAAAVDYPEERGLVPSTVPAAPDESGIVRNVPSWAGAGQGAESYFARYDANRDGTISWEEAQQDPDLLAVFDRADANGDRVLSRNEFHDAAVLAVNERGRAPRGG
jgi:hypothetical protein